MNLAKLLEGPAIVTHRGQLFHSRGGAVLNPEASAFPIETDILGPIDQRHLDNSIALTLTPVGVWTDPVLGVLYRWQNPSIGQLVTPVYDVDTIDTEADTIELVGSEGPRKGCPINVASFGTMPTGLAEATLYYAGVPSDAAPNVISLHATEAHALAGTNLIDLTDDGDGDHTIIEQEPLIIHTTRNRKIVFHNAAVVGMPAINFSAQQTLLGQVVFECFRKNNAAWSTANSLFTITKEALSITAPDPDDIPTQEYSFAWGASPWNSWKTRGAFVISPQLQLAAIESDARGTLGRKIQGISVTAQGAPHGFSEQQMLDVLGLQGGTAARGVSRARADLTITGTDVHCIMRGASAQALPQTFSATDPRAGEIRFVGSRGPDADDAFYVGTAAPA